MLKLGSETSWKTTDDLTASMKWKNVGDLVPSKHVESESSLCVTQSNAECTEAPSNSLADTIRLFDKEPALHAENTVIQTKLSKMIVCFDHGASLSVKDIGVVDSSHSPQKSFLENDVTEKIPSEFESSTTNLNNHHRCRIKGDTLSTPQNLESASVKDNKPPWILSSACGNSNTGDHIKINISYQRNSSKQLHSLGHSVEVSHLADPANFDCGNDRRQRTDQKIIEEVLADETCSRGNVPVDSAESKGSSMEDNPTNRTSEVTLEEEYSETAVAFSGAARVDTSNGTKENLVNDEVKSGETNLDLKSQAVMAFDRKETRENIDSKHIVQIHNNVAEETNSEGAPVSVQSSFYQKDQADLNLSGPFYLRGPETPSGHIAYSGSISLRSDSSTTSTGSFAFPILQSEWNTSPVKMAKAERRHLRKRWLRTAILCCKF